ncbi:MAG: phosphoenolpyruvate synthase [Bacteroidota bacterium]|jgi:pyruvate,water dikinase
MNYCVPFTSIRNSHVAEFGGKNASLGEMAGQLSSLGIRIPEGYAVHAEGYRLFLQENDLVKKLEKHLSSIDSVTLEGLAAAASACRKLIDSCTIPEEVRREIELRYVAMGSPSVAVRSSATAEDLPTASFAGQHESFLNVNGEGALIKAVQDCYRSLFTERAIKYRIDNGFDHMKVALSVGIQRMVRSDRGSAGVAFTLDPETGFRNVVYITGAWGLGEIVVQGAVTPDEFTVFKKTLHEGYDAILQHRLGAKKNKIVYGTDKTSTVTVETTVQEQSTFVLNDAEVTRIAGWCVAIENHYGMPMDIEWAKDGLTGELFILQARPETVHSRQEKPVIREYTLRSKGKVLCKGTAVGNAVVSGPVRIIRSLADADKVQQGDILVAEITHPDWNTLLRKAVSIITDKGGRTSHASIVARELGISAVVGTENATGTLKDGQVVTVSSAEGETGKVYDGKLEWTVKDLQPESTARTRTRPMLILADPSRAFRFAGYPAKGVGLLRMEFIITNSIRVHPMALLSPEKVTDKAEREELEKITAGYTDKKSFFVDRLAESLAVMAAAFHPEDVIVRMSDFKTNEYAELVGGKYFEPAEENPMLGWRGASRYYREAYKPGFGLECAAIRKVREEKGLTNIKVMIPFCRTVEEGRKVLKTMEEFGLKRGDNGLEVYVMAEIPSNVLLAAEFAEIFDGFSIGSNDLTQLTLGVDRDASDISDLFDEDNAAVKLLLKKVILEAKAAGRKIGLCGQAPSDRPEFARFLVECGIDSISFNPDALLRGIENIAHAEKRYLGKYEPVKQ